MLQHFGKNYIKRRKQRERNIPYEKMKFMIILLLICVLSEIPLGVTAQDKWLAATSNIIRIECSGLDHAVEIAWTKFGTLALTIFGTDEGSVKIIKNAAVYQCTAKVFSGHKQLATFRLKVDTTLVSAPDANRSSLETVSLPEKSTVKCRSASSNEPNFIIDWANAVYSSELRRTTISGTFEGIPNVSNSGGNVFMCSGKSGSEITYDNVRVTWAKVSMPVIRLIPSVQVVTIDETADVACEVIGDDPASSIVWYARGSDSQLHYIANNKLHFKNISIQAAGEYFCVAVNEAGWSKESSLVVETISCS